MKAAVLHAKNDLRCEEVEKPVPRSDEVLVKISYCGICGSDMPRVLQGTAHYFPIILGHEFSGVVEAVGTDVKDFKPGDRVSAAPLVPCGECEDCKNGWYSLCKNYDFIGSRLPGAWQDYLCVPARNVLHVPDDVSLEQAAFLEPATVALHGLMLMGFDRDYKPGQRVAVFGMGTIGLLTLQCAKYLGAQEVDVFDIDEAKLAIAEEYGASRAFNTAAEDFDAQVKAACPRGYDWVFEAAGFPATEIMSLKYAGNRSRVMFIGTPSRPVTLQPAEFEYINRKELLVSGSWMSYSAPWPGREWHVALQALGSGVVQTEKLLDSIVPLSQADKAFKRIENREVSGKILLEANEKCN